VNQYDIYIANLDPTRGSEIKKTRSCIIISPDEMNAHLRTVQIAHLTSNTRPYPWRVSIRFRRKNGMVALDQIRTVDKSRLVKKASKATPRVIDGVKAVIHEMLVL